MNKRKPWKKNPAAGSHHWEQFSVGERVVFDPVDGFDEGEVARVNPQKIVVVTDDGKWRNFEPRRVFKMYAKPGEHLDRWMSGAHASLGWVKLRPGDPVRIDPPIRGHHEGVLAELSPYHASVVTDDGLRSLVDQSRLSRLETSSFATQMIKYEGPIDVGMSAGAKVFWWGLGLGLAAWWLWPDSDLSATEQSALTAAGVVWCKAGDPTPASAVGLIEGATLPVMNALGFIRATRLSDDGYRFWTIATAAKPT
jgi:hypothetical protein